MKKRGRENLKLDEEKFRTFIESSPDCIKVLDLEGNLLFINRAGLREHRIKNLKEAINCGWKAIESLSPEDRKKFSKALDWAKKGKSTKFEIKHTPEGSINETCEETITPIKLKGKVTQILAISKNIAERKKAEEELKEKEEKLKSLVYNIPGMIYMAKPDWTAEIISGSKEICGYSPEEFKSKRVNWTDIIHPNDKKNVFAQGNELTKKEKKIIQVYRIITKDKKIRWIKDRKISIFEKGKFKFIYGIVYDITSEKKAEEELIHLKEGAIKIAAEQKYKILYDSSADAIMTLEPPSWKFTSGNLATIKMFNCKNEKDFISRPPWKYSPKYQPDGELSSTKAKKMIMKAVRDGSNFFEWTHTRKKDGDFPATVLLTRVKEDQRIYLQATVRDLTKEKEAERKYQELFENAVDAIFIADQKTKRIVECNKKAEKLLGFPKEKILSMKAEDLHPTDKLKETMIAFKKQAEGKITFFDTEVLTKDKKRIPVSINASKVFIKNEEYLQGIFRDQTKEKEQINLLKNIINSSQDMIFVKDTQLRTILCNTAYSQSVGKKPEEMYGHTDIENGWLPELVKGNPEKGIRGFENDDKEALNGKIIHNVNDPANVGGKIFIFNTIKLPLKNENGEIIGVLGIARDVTKEKEADIQKTEFISAISHELRTPITPIKAQTQRMLSSEIGKEEQKEALEIILRNTKRLDRLIQDLLEMNRIRSGKFSILKKREDINAIILESIASLEGLAKDNQTSIKFVKGKIPIINLDRDRILEVVINLMDNAIKYGGGEIEIETKREGNYIKISVKDNGVGIPENEQEKIFSPFYRGKKEEIRKFEGTGLGLSISKAIVEAHRGKIKVKSEMGKGTEFRVILPVR